MQTLPSLDNLAKISQTIHQIETGQLTRARAHDIIDTLTPEQIAIWEQLAPMILNPDFYVVDNWPSEGSWFC